MIALENRDAGGFGAEGGFDGGDRGGIGLVGVGDQYGVGAADGAGRLAEQAARKDAAESERLGGVNQGQFKIAISPPMLHAIVEDEERGVGMAGEGGGAAAGDGRGRR